MKQFYLLLIMLVSGLILSACSSNANQNTTAMATNNTANANGTQMLAANGAVGGDLTGHMDSNDKQRLYHALDVAPGKSTHWTNDLTGISYTVTPTKKVEMAGSAYCRAYTVMANRGTNTQELNGTACVAADGTWQEVKG